VLIEAMAAGTPVVSVKGMGQDEALSQGGGVIVEEDLNEFTQRVVALLADKQSLQRLAGEARTAVKRFSVANSVEALVQVYQQALEDFSNRPENNSKKDQIKVEAVLPGFEETLFLGDKHLWR
jgi:glycosyltransferase involved in cell wall biosynthesis